MYISTPVENIDQGGKSMEWVYLVFDHSTVTIIFLVLCLLILNFGSILWAIIIAAILFALSVFI